MVVSTPALPIPSAFIFSCEHKSSTIAIGEVKGHLKAAVAAHLKPRHLRALERKRRFGRAIEVVKPHRLRRFTIAGEASTGRRGVRWRTNVARVACWSIGVNVIESRNAHLGVALVYSLCQTRGGKWVKVQNALSSAWQRYLLSILQTAGVRPLWRGCIQNRNVLKGEHRVAVAAVICCYTFPSAHKGVAALLSSIFFRAGVAKRKGVTNVFSASTPFQDLEIQLSTQVA